MPCAVVAEINYTLTVRLYRSEDILFRNAIAEYTGDTKRAYYTMAKIQTRLKMQLQDATLVFANEFAVQCKQSHAIKA